MATGEGVFGLGRGRGRGARGEWLARLHSLQEIAHAVNSDLHLDTVLQTIVDTVVINSPWPQCCIARLNRTSQEVSFVAERGFIRPDLGGTSSWPVGGSITPRAVELGETLAFEDILAEPAYPMVSADARERGYRAVLVVPLRGIDPPTAVWFCGDQPHRFTADEIAHASAIADQAAIAIKNAELHDRERTTIVELERLNQLIAHQNGILERQASNHVRLTQMVLSDQGLDAILESATAVLGGRARMYDRWLQPLGAAMHGPSKTELPAGIPRLASETRRPFIDSAGAVIAPVMVGRELLGLLQVLPGDRPFADEDLTVVEQIVMVLALELMKRRIAHEVELRIQGDFLGQLLSPGPSDGRELQARAALLGIDLARPTQLLLFALDAPSPSTDELAALANRRELLDAVRHVLANLAPNPVAVLQGWEVVVLLPARDDGPTYNADTMTAARVRVQALIGASVSVSYGGTCVALGEYQRAYRLACKALKIQAMLGRSGQLCSFDDLGVYGLLFSEENAAELSRFAGQLLGVLGRYDQQHHTSLLHTLEVFLQLNGNLRRTAAELVVHISTLRYRLQRMEELTHLTLDDPEDRFRLQLAFRIEKLTRASG